MSNQTAILASAVVAGFVSIISIASVSVSAARAAGDETPAAAAEECLSGPKATTPAGGHWYYRIEKGTKRKCWYLGDAGAKVNKPAETAAAPVADEDAPPPPKKPLQKSVANARAELRAGSPDEDRSLSESTWPPLTPSDQAAVRDNNQIAAIQPPPEQAQSQVQAQGWNIASRWPEPKAVVSAENQSNATAPEPMQPTPALTPDRLVMAAATAPPASATPVATAPQPDHAANAVATNDTESFPIRILLSILVCALALTAIIGPMVFRYIRPRRKERVPVQRRPIWDVDTPDEAGWQDTPRMPSRAHRRYVDPLPEPQVLDEAVDELENLLARASRRPAA